jgi:hypothetical protein
MNTTIESLEQRHLRTDLPQFKAGDTVRVHFKVIEGNRRRIQVFEGICIKRQGSGFRETFTVRKQSSRTRRGADPAVTVPLPLTEIVSRTCATGAPSAPPTANAKASTGRMIRSRGSTLWMADGCKDLLPRLLVRACAATH